MKLQIFLPILLSVHLLMFNIREVDAQKRVLIRCDDTGMCHAVNMALKKLIETKIPFSTSVMFGCPWYQEAVDILKEHPEVSV